MLGPEHLLADRDPLLVELVVSHRSSGLSHPAHRAAQGSYTRDDRVGTPAAVVPRHPSIFPARTAKPLEDVGEVGYAGQPGLDRRESGVAGRTRGGTAH
jgi:hypothetical protein